RQSVGIYVENFAAGIVAENKEICQLSNTCATVDQTTDDCRIGLQQWVGLIILHNGKCDFGICSRLGYVDGIRPARDESRAANEFKAALPDIPTQIGAGSDLTDLLYRILAYIGHKHCRFWNPRKCAEDCGFRKRRFRRVCWDCCPSRTDSLRECRTSCWHCCCPEGPLEVSCRTPN